MAALFQPRDLSFLPPLAITRDSHPGTESMNLIAWLGFMTKAVVDMASASIAVGAITDTLVLSSGESPVLGSTMWFQPYRIGPFPSCSSVLEFS
jgi:hypothetical protein